MRASIRAGLREHRASILVSGLSAAFGVVLIGAVDTLAAASGSRRAANWSRHR